MLCISQGRHFIGQAFHPDGTLTTASFHRAGGAGRINPAMRGAGMDIQDILSVFLMKADKHNRLGRG